MSSGDRISLTEALDISRDFMEHIKKIPGHYVEAGSIRRRKATIGDIEIVCLPNNRAELLNRLDVLEDMDVVKKAIYGNATRWGDKMRGLLYQKVQVEVIIADADNYGYQLWLRTGPGDKNQYVMTRMLQSRTPVRFTEGYAYHVSYDATHPEYKADKGFAKLAKLAIKDEWTLYHLLGMPEILPWKRTEQEYRRHIGQTIRHMPEDVIRALYAESNIPKQMSMF